MKKVVFIFILALGFAWNCRAQTWTFLQDGVMTSCNAGSSACTFQGNNVLPTTAGSVMIVRIHTQNNVKIASVSGGGGTWQLCPASSCHVFDSAFNDNQDLAYNLSGTGAATNFSVTLSGAASGFFGGNFMEFLPPTGATASFDTAGITASSTCNPCTGVSLAITATDLVVQVLSGNGAGGPQSSPQANAWHAFSAPYMTDYASNGINLNATSGAAPTVSLPSAGGDFSAIAFKTSSGSYTPPAQPISIVSYTQVLGPSCGPTCTIKIPSTGTGNLLYIEAADLNGSFISSVSGAGTGWVVPTGGNSCRISTGGNALSCAYELSDTSGTTSLSVTMTGSGSTYFAVYEIGNTGGPFSFDTQGSGTDPGTPALTERGIALTLSGSNDVIFQNAFIPGGTNVVSLYPQPLNSNGQGTNFFSDQTNGAANAQSVALLNTKNGTAPFWINGGGTNNGTTLVASIAFKTGSGTAPAPPTGLAAVVN